MCEAWSLFFHVMHACTIVHYACCEKNGQTTFGCVRQCCFCSTQNTFNENTSKSGKLTINKSRSTLRNFRTHFSLPVLSPSLSHKDFSRVTFASKVERTRRTRVLLDKIENKYKSSENKLLDLEIYALKSRNSFRFFGMCTTKNAQ